ncbi:hypothetical protein BDP55DRAFT_639368 [Colletotrichum godetiae]|uniref:Uncharacterized protein n=1 Tax=Colletotrichum godetiae TaxID=1209918 RepID=A0AAJ0EMM6_9PEZI|nr:uncharacterized protein BDP55DRAFT_639368 [Colletotrichum godetiae]KAK1656732.1 hypothetical protein BDP55DRAFT_639368 [Colletotrichum godetiae]
MCFSKRSFVSIVYPQYFDVVLCSDSVPFDDEVGQICRQPPVVREVDDGRLVCLERRPASPLPFECSIDDVLDALTVFFSRLAGDPRRIVVDEGERAPVLVDLVPYEVGVEEEGRAQVTVDACRSMGAEGVNPSHQLLRDAPRSESLKCTPAVVLAPALVHSLNDRKALTDKSRQNDHDVERTSWKGHHRRRGLLADKDAGDCSATQQDPFCATGWPKHCTYCPPFERLNAHLTNHINQRHLEPDKKCRGVGQASAEERADREQERAEATEQQTQPTSLNEYIPACHSLASARLTVETDQHRIRHPLLHFPADRRCSESISFLSGRGSRIAKRKITDEKALECFLQYSVEGPVKAIMDELKKVKEVQKAFDLVNGLVFENHPHALSDAAAEVVERNLPSTPISTRHNRKVDFQQSRAASSLMLYIPEYKSPRQLPAQHLRSMNALEEVLTQTRGSGITRRGSPQPPSHTDLSYMIEDWLEHGLLTTGEAIVCVRLEWRESETLSFHLAEPSAEVEAYLKHADLRTAVAQYLAFGLIALGVPGERHECRHPP